MKNDKFRVVKVTIKTGCDLSQETVKANLSRAKANDLRDALESGNEKGDFDPHAMVSYLVQPMGSMVQVGAHPTA
jgi:hypothetical protein